jgi:triosephosphate isomerase
MRKPIIAGNHKMNLLPSEGVKFIKELKKIIESQNNVEVIVFPPFTSINAMKQELEKSDIALGAQNIYYEQSGAFTGEVAANMVAELGCEWVLCGHSERREIFEESNKVVNLKIKATLKNDLSPMLCVGETLEQREAGKTEETLIDQVVGSLADLKENDLTELVVAYEPVWAIGTGKTATPEDAQTGVLYIRNRLSEMFGEEFAQSTRILYGGSVKPSNVKELMAQEDIDGALVGGASLKAESFAKLVKYNE